MGECSQVWRPQSFYDIMYQRVETSALKWSSYLQGKAFVTDVHCDDFFGCEENVICLKREGKGRLQGKFCRGDSGGFIGTLEPTFIQFGIISYGPAGLEVKYPKIMLLFCLKFIKQFVLLCKVP